MLSILPIHVKIQSHYYQICYFSFLHSKGLDTRITHHSTPQEDISLSILPKELSQDVGRAYNQVIPILSLQGLLVKQSAHLFPSQ